MNQRLRRHGEWLIPVFAAVFGAWPSAADAALSPMDRFTSDAKSCQQDWATLPANSTSWGCTICGASVSCTEGKASLGTTTFAKCTWGALLFTSAMTPEEEQAGVYRGLQMYCAGSGGVMVQAASSAGVQTKSLSGVFDSMGRGQRKGAPKSGGAVYEFTYASFGDASSNTHGIAIPFAFPLKSGPTSGADLRGNAIFGYGDGVMQYGLNATPTYTWITMGADQIEGARGVVGLSLPVQFVGTSGAGLDFGISYLAGLGVLGGVASTSGANTIGIGASADFHYGSGIQAPATVAFRASHDMSGFTRLVFQPAVSVEIEALGEIVDTIRPSVALGLEIGKWIVGLQGFFQQDVYTGGLGVSYVDAVSQAAGGNYQPDSITQSPPPAAAPPPGTYGYPPQQQTYQQQAYQQQPQQAPVYPQQQQGYPQQPPPGYAQAPMPPQYPPQYPPPQYGQPIPPQTQVYPQQQQPTYAATTQYPPQYGQPPAPTPPAQPPAAAPQYQPYQYGAPTPQAVAAPIPQQPPAQYQPHDYAAPPPAQPPATYPTQPQPAPAPAYGTPPVVAAPIPVPTPAPAAPDAVACTDTASCISQTQNRHADPSCPNAVTATFSNSCHVPLVCNACPSSAGTVFKAACQKVAVPSTARPPASVSFCGADQIVWKCAAQGEHAACFDL